MKILASTLVFAALLALFSNTSFASPSTVEGIQVYQKNAHLSPLHKQNLAEDINRYRNADNMWDTLRQEFALSHYEDNPRVQEQIEWFMENPDFLVRAATRAGPFFYYILQQIRKRHLPAEFALLPMMESAYNPLAYSSAGAAGIWQMMPGTASGYGIKQNWWYDGRRDVIASTKAALNHLVYLENFFNGNWLLAIAAYDTGEGNVQAAIRKNIRNGENTDFWSLPVAQEARIYVPRLLALAIIISHPDQYPIDFPAVRNAPYLAQVDIGAQIDLKHAAGLAGLSLKTLKLLNPGYNRSATDPNGPYKITLPIENVEHFTQNLALSPLYQRVNWIHYKTKSGDTLAGLAKKFNTTIATIRNNNPALSSKLKLATNLVIPRTTPTISKTILESEQKQEQEQAQEQKTVKSRPKKAVVLDSFQGNYTLKPGDTLYIIRPGDNLKKIANRFHTTVMTLQVANQLSGNTSVKPGSKLIIPTHQSEPQKYRLTNGDTIYIVRKNDTIEKIADKFHTSPSNIRLSNLLVDNNITEGDRLIIPTHEGS